jgi:hypothetical protein
MFMMGVLRRFEMILQIFQMISIVAQIFQVLPGPALWRKALFLALKITPIIRLVPLEMVEIAISSFRTYYVVVASILPERFRQVAHHLAQVNPYENKTHFTNPIFFTV